MPERFGTIYEKCKFLSMGYISALTQASVLIRSKNVGLLFKVIAKDTNNMSYTVRYGLKRLITTQEGVTLAQLVKASVGQADVQRFEPHLGHNWLSCGVFLVKSRHFGLPLAQTIRPNWQSLLAGGSVAIQTWSIYKVYT